MYAAGYKIGSGLNIQKTGILVIETTPTNGKVLINNEPIYGFFNILKKDSYLVSPAKINNLLPGEYKIRIELDGYWPWEKQLDIRSGQTTFAEDIKLFKKEVPLSLASGDFNTLSMSPDKKYLVAQSGNEIALVNLRDDSFVKYSSPQTDVSTDYSWNDSSKVIIGALLFDVNDWTNPIDLKNPTAEKADSYQFAAGSDTIIYQGTSSINRLDLSTKAFTPIFKAEVKNLSVQQNNIYLISPGKSSDKLTIADYENQAQKIEIQIPSSKYKFINGLNNYINLYNETSKSLYIIDPATSLRPISEVITNVNTFTWINEKELLYANDFEIWTLNIESKTKNLVTRMSKEIKNVLWHPKNGHIIFSTNNSLSIIELDDREKYNITKLLELTEIKNPSLSKDGSVIYFIGKIGDLSGVYKLNIN